ncbi:MAG: hypothetical protein GY946_17245 [bacterium]|nr:hypothetical protein [bacterium]
MKWPALALLIALLAGCDNATPTTPGGTAPDGAAPGKASQREQVLGEFLETHWNRPVRSQGPSPEGWSPLEASLDPKDCGACHPQQLADWETSLHADAFSPGFAGQLIEGNLAKPDALRGCQRCHTPLEEQQPVGPGPEHTLEPPEYDEKLRQAGLVCAGCHVRAHRHFGPPRRADLPPPPEAVPHAGFEVRPEFQQSRFCAPCHQFFDRSGINVQNTYFEWKESPHAARGETCQSCHMPDRRHLWRGIHDREMVAEAVDVAWADGEPLALVLTARAVGHAFPSYVTPRVVMSIWQQDATGKPIEGTRIEHTIGRKVDFRKGEDIFDTRVPPGGTARLSVTQPPEPEAVAWVGQVTVDPDFHYRGVFERYLPTLEDAKARAQIARALERSQRSSYVLAELRRPR